jgi:hypothetical protein
MQKYKSSLLIFGGESNFNETIKQRECQSDVYLYDIFSKKQSKPRCSGEIPEARTQFASFIIDKYLGIHGGINSKNTYLNELFIMDLTSFKWQQVNYLISIPEYSNILYNHGVAFH